MKKAHFNKDSALLVAGIIFGIVALVHLLRIFMQFNLLIARQLLPVWISFPAFFVFLGLAVWMFMARKSSNKRAG